MEKYDICVIGAGSGGLVAATTANRLGARTALVEKYKIGGECLHLGCVPSKTFIASAKAYHMIKNSKKFGLPEIKIKNFNFADVMGRVNSVVGSIYQHESPQVFRDMGIDVYMKTAEFITNKQLKVGGDSIIEADYFIICTGSSPLILPIPGLDTISYNTNETFWEMQHLPDSMLFIGGGPISVEIGQSLARFGCNITIVELSERILSSEDEEISEDLKKLLIEEGVQILTNSKVVSLKKKTSQVIVTIESGGKTKDLTVDSIFLSIGRKPNIDDLNLESAGVKYSRRGLEVNEYLQTSATNIFACGDIVGPFKFTHTGSYQADIVVNNILNEEKKKNDLSVLPWTIFTDPEIAHVGLTEKQAREQNNINPHVLRVDASGIDRFIAEGKTRGFIKIILDENDLVIGANAFCAHSGEYIQILTQAIKYKLPIQGLAETIYAYPTFAEIIRKAFVRYMRTKT
jgi:pyruvate/2-oxoglutarate dehydrogenase complex dihydrolipoamide dehydrogenase (E3) component